VKTHDWELDTQCLHCPDNLKHYTDFFDQRLTTNPAATVTGIVIHIDGFQETLNVFFRLEATL
ncbi:unnamed protein product, partial [Amoebophrya sp. A120]